MVIKRGEQEEVATLILAEDREVDPVDGHIKRIIGDTKQNDIWGFGYWAGKGYGFSAGGKVLQINMATGASTVLQTLMNDAGTVMPWYGAGVTTQAPAN